MLFAPRLDHVSVTGPIYRATPQASVTVTGPSAVPSSEIAVPTAVTLFRTWILPRWHSTAIVSHKERRNL